MSPAEIYAAVGPSVGRVEFAGELYSGEREVGTGTAFLISDSGLMLTCKHVVPVLTNYKSSTFRVRLGGPGSKAVYDATAVWTAPGSQDLALIRIEIEKGPVVPFGPNAKFGAPVVVMGFPVDLDLNITQGLVSGPGPNGRNVMQTPINPGNSGGPVLDLDGEAVGVVWGAALKWKEGSEEIPLEGIKFFIPLSAVTSTLPAEFQAEIARSGSKIREKAGFPSEIHQAFEVEWIKDDHPKLSSDDREYQQRIAAQPGYRITAFKVSTRSRNNASNLAVEIAPDGSSALVSSTITSGPLFDQWRGWLSATVEFEQRRQ